MTDSRRWPPSAGGQSLEERSSDRVGLDNVDRQRAARIERPTILQCLLLPGRSLLWLGCQSRQQTRSYICMALTPSPSAMLATQKQFLPEIKRLVRPILIRSGADFAARGAGIWVSSISRAPRSESCLIRRLAPEVIGVSASEPSAPAITRTSTAQIEQHWTGTHNRCTRLPQLLQEPRKFGFSGWRYFALKSSPLG